MTPSHSTHNPTAALLDAARAGDAQARGQLLERHRAALRRLVEARFDRKLRPRVDASDIVQDVMLEADLRLNDYLRSARIPFPLWLRLLAQDRMIDVRRQHRGAARRSVDREQGLAQPPASSTAGVHALPVDAELTPAAAAMRRELDQRFQQAMEQLDATDREIVLLRHFEQLTNRHTAEFLQLTEAAAAMRYLRAMRRLRELLRDA